MVVIDECLAKCLVKARDRLGDQDGTEPEKPYLYPPLQPAVPGDPEHVELLPPQRLAGRHVVISINLGTVVTTQWSGKGLDLQKWSIVEIST